MQPNCLILPLDLEQRDDVRLFQKITLRHLSDAGETSGAVRAEVKPDKALRTLYVVRLWMDYGKNQTEWRPLKNPVREGVQIDWAAEDICHIIEEFCEWKGKTGELIAMFLESGILALAAHGDLNGLLLKDFSKYNPHLLPGYRSIQSQGGRALKAKRHASENATLAEQQHRLLQGTMKLEPDLAASQEEEKKAILLVLRMFRACQLPVPSSEAYTKPLVTQAVNIIRKHDNNDITLVEIYLRDHIEDPGVVKIPERIIHNFGDYLKHAGS